MHVLEIDMKPPHQERDSSFFMTDLITTFTRFLDAGKSSGIVEFSGA